MRLLSFVFLLCFRISVSIEVEDTLGRCGEVQQCLPQNDCPSFLEKKVNYQSLTRGSTERASALVELKNLICNNSERGACCPEPKSCKAVKVEDCEALAEDYKDFRSSDRAKKTAALAKIKKLVCNKRKRLVWCGACTGGPCTEEDSVEEEALILRGGRPLPQEAPSYLPGAGMCGQGAIFSARVVGGNQTFVGEYPFMALLGYNRSRVERDYPAWGQNTRVYYTQWSCGGALINHWFVMTAAHCHSKSRSRYQISQVRLGEWGVQKTDSERDCSEDGNCLPQFQDFDITPDLVTVHPDYTKTLSRGVYNDIALIRLPRKAVVDGYGVQVVCLPIDAAITAAELGLAGLDQAGTRPRVVGWGYTEGNPLDRNKTDSKTVYVASKRQFKVDLPLLSEDRCSSSLGTRLRSTQLCAGGEEGKDSCNGDSGGPLVLAKGVDDPTVDPGTFPWYQLGIVSFGTKVCGSGTPGVYTKVLSFIPWIRAVIAQ